jgi:hypothetical protein
MNNPQNKMKIIDNNLMRRAQAVLATGLVVGRLFAASAQTLSLPPQTSPYLVKSNYAVGAVAPYNSGGGVTAAAYQTPTVIITPTNFTLNWYGVQGWYNVEAMNVTASGPWTTIASVASSSFAGTYTGPKPDPTNSYLFRLALTNNYYVGSDQCSSCHGDKYAGYSKTKHSHAYTDPSAIAMFGTNCLTVGYGVKSGFVDPATTPNLENVGCENCHGPAAWHKNSEHDAILPVVSLDPSICGSCHQGSQHPTFQEYTNVISTVLTNLPMGILRGGVGHNAGDHGGGCAFCHEAPNRIVMVNEYYDNLAGNPHPLTLFPAPINGVFGAADCATCHNPHGSNYLAQLRYPTFSTNFYALPALLYTATSVVTNYNGTLTTNSLTMNNVFDQIFNPKVQVCGQCHSTRGTRWDGSAYGLVTNQVASTATNTVYVDITTNVTVTQVFTNTVPPTTNSYTYIYVVGRYATNVVTSQTNPVVGVGVYYPLIAYTNGGTVYYSSNSSGESAPHYPVQYNMLVGQLDYDLAARGGPANVLNDPHTLAPNQCIDCHVPNYAVNAGTNVTGHTFVSDNNGCLASCHASLGSTAALATKTLNSKMTCSNSIDRVVSLLKQWGMTVAPAILRTNYGTCAWELPSPLAYFGAKSTNIVGSVTNKYLVGPPSKWNGLGGQPSGTNDNVQLNYVPQDIRMARFSLYMIYEDQSYGVHNPTYVKSLLADAEARVMNQFVTSNYWGAFSADVTSGTNSLTVNFSNNYSGGSTYAWNFGDGTGVTNSTPNTAHTYTTGLYSVTCTVDGAPLTRTKYILVQ